MGHTQIRGHETANKPEPLWAVTERSRVAQDLPPQMAGLRLGARPAESTSAVATQLTQVFISLRWLKSQLCRWQ